MKRTLNKKFIKWFTLVELIIVITILAILATIAFISFQWYSKNARDGNRLTTMKNISKWLEIFKVQTWNYPQPDESINIEASWTLIWYQWKVWDAISRMIKINVTPTDPYDKEKYIYSTSSDKTKYQILWYLETPDYLTLLNQSYAADYNSRYVKTLWDKVWVLLDENKKAVGWVAKVDVATWSTIYNIYFWDNDIVNWSWNLLFSNIYNRRSDLINNKNIASLDTSLVWYWDFENVVLNWNQATIDDLTNYKNNLSCSTANLWWVTNNWNKSCPSFINWEKWLSAKFMAPQSTTNSDHNYLEIISPNKLDNPEFTYSLLIKPDMILQDDNVSNVLLTIKSSQSICWNSAWSILYYDSLLKRIALKTATTDNWWTTRATNFNNIILEKNKRINLVLTYSSNNVTIYIDWIKIWTKIMPWDWLHYYNWTPVYLFWAQPNYSCYRQWTNYWNTYWYNWEMDEVRLYNRALSDSEIQELYNSTK